MSTILAITGINFASTILHRSNKWCLSPFSTIFPFSNPLSAQGVPYVIESFKVAGVPDPAQDMDKIMPENLPMKLTSDYAGIHTNEFPQDITVISFPE